MFLKRSFPRRSSAQPTSPSPSSSSPSSPSPPSSSVNPLPLNQVRRKSQARLSTPASKRVSIADDPVPPLISLAELESLVDPLANQTESRSSTSFDSLASSSSSLDTVQTSSSTVKVATAPKHDSGTLRVLMKELGVEKGDQRRFLRSHSSKTPLTADRIDAIIEHEMLVQISHKRDEMIYAKTLPRTFRETNCVHDVYHPSNASRLSEGEKAMMSAKEAIFRPLLLGKK